MPRSRSTASKNTSVRLPLELDERVQALVERLSARSVQPVTTSYVINEIVRLGLPLFEAQAKRSKPAGKVKP